MAVSECALAGVAGEASERLETPAASLAQGHGATRPSPLRAGLGALPVSAPGGPEMGCGRDPRRPGGAVLLSVRPGASLRGPGRPRLDPKPAGVFVSGSASRSHPPAARERQLLQRGPPGRAQVTRDGETRRFNQPAAGRDEDRPPLGPRGNGEAPPCTRAASWGSEAPLRAPEEAAGLAWEPSVPAEPSAGATVAGPGGCPRPLSSAGFSRGPCVPVLRPPAHSVTAATPPTRCSGCSEPAALARAARPAASPEEEGPGGARRHAGRRFLVFGKLDVCLTFPSQQSQAEGLRETVPGAGMTFVSGREQVAREPGQDGPGSSPNTRRRGDGTAPVLLGECAREWRGRAVGLRRTLPPAPSPTAKQTACISPNSSPRDVMLGHESGPDGVPDTTTLANAGVPRLDRGQQAGARDLRGDVSWLCRADDPQPEGGLRAEGTVSRQRALKGLTLSHACQPLWLSYATVRSHGLTEGAKEVGGVWSPQPERRSSLSGQTFVDLNAKDTSLPASLLTETPAAVPCVPSGQLWDGSSEWTADLDRPQRTRPAWGRKAPLQKPRAVSVPGSPHLTFGTDPPVGVALGADSVAESGDLNADIAWKPPQRPPRAFGPATWTRAPAVPGTRREHSASREGPRAARAHGPPPSPARTAGCAPAPAFTLRPGSQPGGTLGPRRAPFRATCAAPGAPAKAGGAPRAPPAAPGPREPGVRRGRAARLSEGRAARGERGPAGPRGCAARRASLLAVERSARGPGPGLGRRIPAPATLESTGAAKAGSGPAQVVPSGLRSCRSEKLAWGGGWPGPGSAGLRPRLPPGAPAGSPGGRGRGPGGPGGRLGARAPMSRSDREGAWAWRPALGLGAQAVRWTGTPHGPSGDPGRVHGAPWLSARWPRPRAPARQPPGPSPHAPRTPAPKPLETTHDVAGQRPLLPSHPTPFLRFTEDDIKHSRRGALPTPRPDSLRPAVETPSAPPAPAETALAEATDASWCPSQWPFSVLRAHPQGCGSGGSPGEPPPTLLLSHVSELRSSNTQNVPSRGRPPVVLAPKGSPPDPTARGPYRRAHPSPPTRPHTLGLQAPVWSPWDPPPHRRALPAGASTAPHLRGVQGLHTPIRSAPPGPWLLPPQATGVSSLPPGLRPQENAAPASEDVCPAVLTRSFRNSQSRACGGPCAFLLRRGEVE
ncbi:collagen alpha-1(I) chain-like [Hippopotamus amphibius kiboko]|uniref:collagen alpha-1(I) chain-like n=1 Tax=Hippopotamus amphibius kiboko TaxID=575201 RepID=UPI0025947531|nr:collagen alpha-1(I) chain-like [Hippopotamus amphibius kiboko]